MLVSFLNLEIGTINLTKIFLSSKPRHFSPLFELNCVIALSFLTFSIYKLSNNFSFLVKIFEQIKKLFSLIELL